MSSDSASTADTPAPPRPRIQIIYPAPGSLNTPDRLVYGYPISYEFISCRLREMRKEDLPPEDAKYYDHFGCRIKLTYAPLERACEELDPDGYCRPVGCRIVPPPGEPGREGVCTVLAIGKRGQTPSKEIRDKIRKKMRELGLYTKPGWYRVDSDKREL